MNIDSVSTFSVYQDGSVTGFLQSQCLLQKLSDEGQGEGESCILSSTSPTTCQPPGSLSSLSRYKTELCRPFEELGRCRYGDKCQFAHGVDDLRTVERHPKHKTELCRSFHTTGLCPYGARCHFIHNELNQQKPQDMISGYAGILAAPVHRAPLMIALGSTSTDPPSLPPATRAQPLSSQCEPPCIPPSPRASLTHLSQPCPVLSLELDLGSIVQRRRQLRGSVDSPSEWSMSGSSLSSSTDSSSSSPITSFLDETFSPALTCSVFSPPIGQYLTSRSLLPGPASSSIGSCDGFSGSVPIPSSMPPNPGNLPTSDSSALMLPTDLNRLPEKLKSEALLRQVIPTMEQLAGKPQTFGFNGKVFGFNPVLAIRSNLDNSLKNERMFGSPPIQLTTLVPPTVYLMTEDMKALNLIGQ